MVKRKREEMIKIKKIIGILTIEIIALILIFYFLKSIQNLPQCWIYQTTGLLCPACGGTRCVIFLFKGNIIKSFLSHSIFFMAMVYLFIVNVVILINLKREKKVATWIYPKYWYGIIFIIILFIYTIIRNLL